MQSLPLPPESRQQAGSYRTGAVSAITILKAALECSIPASASFEAHQKRNVARGCTEQRQYADLSSVHHVVHTPAQIAQSLPQLSR